MMPAANSSSNSQSTENRWVFYQPVCHNDPEPSRASNSAATSSAPVRGVRYRRGWNKAYYLLRQVSLVLGIVLLAVCLATYTSTRGSKIPIPAGTPKSDPVFTNMWLSAPLASVIIAWYIFLAFASWAMNESRQKYSNRAVPGQVTAAVNSLIATASLACFIVSVVQIPRKQSQERYEYPYDWMDAILATFLGLSM
jgi:hypothetical protein